MVPSQVHALVGSESKGQVLGAMVAAGAVVTFFISPLIGMKRLAFIVHSIIFPSIHQFLFLCDYLSYYSLIHSCVHLFIHSCFHPFFTHLFFQSYVIWFSIASHNIIIYHISVLAILLFLYSIYPFFFKWLIFSFSPCLIHPSIHSSFQYSLHSFIPLFHRC